MQSNIVLQSIIIERQKERRRATYHKWPPRQVAEPPAPAAPIGSRSDAEAAAGAPAAPPPLSPAAAPSAPHSGVFIAHEPLPAAGGPPVRLPAVISPPPSPEVLF
jgi:hypothetical protein